jgi:Bacteriophage peptidoglycan hydrolase
MAGILSKMLDYMLAQKGKPYSQEIPERFGPHVFDCSGLIWAAAHAAGYALPGGPSDDAAGIVDPELQWFASQPGSTIITNRSQIQRGDVLGFMGADPPGGTITVGGHRVAGMGHIGMATSSTEYISAYDTQEGVSLNPISGDVFVIGVRPSGSPGGSTGSVGASGNGNITNTGGSLVGVETKSNTESSGIWGDIASGITTVGGVITDPVQATVGVAEGISGFTQDVSHFLKMVDWFFEPSSWVRILAGVAGFVLICIAAGMLYKSAGGTFSLSNTPASSGSMPKVIPIPV